VSASAFLKGALLGAAFGAVLYKVGATRYSRVMGMLTLRDTKVMKFAFTAIGVASLLYGVAAALGLSEPLGLVPRVMPWLGGAHLLPYLNRLADLLWVLARAAEQAEARPATQARRSSAY